MSDKIEDNAKILRIVPESIVDVDQDSVEFILTFSKVINYDQNGGIKEMFIQELVLTIPRCILQQIADKAGINQMGM